MKKYIFLFLKGIGMGAADVVPGVSGGTIAFITGIYEELINSIKSVNLQSAKTLFAKGIADFWKTINGTFLVVLMVGIFTSVLTLAHLIEHLLENYPVLVWSFFFGLIIGSAVYIGSTIQKWNLWTIIAVVGGAAAAYFITSITPAQTTESYWFVFLSGSIAICAMILPGISGSFILVLLGKYEFIIGAVKELKIEVIAVFGIGAVVGLLAFSNLLSWLLKKYREITIAVLAGFMLGSLNKVWPWKIDVSPMLDGYKEGDPEVLKNIFPNIAANHSEFIYALLLAIAGFLLVFAIERISIRFREKEEILKSEDTE